MGYNGIGIQHLHFGRNRRLLHSFLKVVTSGRSFQYHFLRFNLSTLHYTHCMPPVSYFFFLTCLAVIICFTGLLIAYKLVVLTETFVVRAVIILMTNAIC